MTTPIMFDVQGSDIRFGVTEGGRPYAVASDYAKAMGYTRTSDALKLLDDDEKGAAICRTPGGKQELRVIFEDGMWELIFRSSLPGAKAIKTRVKAILRQIRETGRYEVEAEPARIGAATVTWDHAAAVARLQHGLNVDAHGFKELLTAGGPQRDPAPEVGAPVLAGSIWFPVGGARLRTSPTDPVRRQGSPRTGPGGEGIADVAALPHRWPDPRRA
jgi:prophage antirepressor-like protein